MSDPDPLLPAIERLSGQIERLNTLLEKQNRRLGWQGSLRAGLLIGLGSVVGATVLVSLLALFLRPFANVEFFRPYVEQTIKDLERDRER
ncbi:MAG: hypothetical protein AMXMBFR81_21980 [Chthonomonas sp.]|nr:hypothetical protein [Fimbriimonadaceae bacterium]